MGMLCPLLTKDILCGTAHSPPTVGHIALMLTFTRSNMQPVDGLINWLNTSDPEECRMVFSIEEQMANRNVIACAACDLWWLTRRVTDRSLYPMFNLLRWSCAQPFIPCRFISCWWQWSEILSIFAWPWNALFNAF